MKQSPVSTLRWPTAARTKPLYMGRPPQAVVSVDYYIFCWCWKNTVTVPLRRAIFSSAFMSETAMQLRST